MGFARCCSVALVGVDGVVIEVQADLEPGVPAFSIVGLPDKALNESRDRVRAAVVNSGEKWPQKRLTIGLSPASVPKSGSGFDLAVAAAILAAEERIPAAGLAGVLLIGELGLDGRARPVRGVLPSVLAAADAGYRRVVVPEATAAEAALVPGVEVRGVRSLRELVALLGGEPPAEDPSGGRKPIPEEGPDEAAGGGPRDPLLAGLMLPGAGIDARGPEAGRRLDLAEVAGQHQARKALEIAAAGGHHLLLKGPPGAGKTMLAERLPGLLPPLEPHEALEVTAVHSVAGLLPTGQPLLERPPYCAPHHSTTMAAVVGGGSGLPRPGAVSLAHRGVLFLDEAPEFSMRVLDSLRQPLESGRIVVARAHGSLTLPARFLLVLAANPCPCGRFSLRGGGCECPPRQRERYFARLSGPLLDRVDLQVEVAGVSRVELLEQQEECESSETVAARVRQARKRAAARYAETPWRLNAEVPGHELRTRWPVASGALGPAERDMERGLLTARGLDRVLRVAWTIADLHADDRPGPDHIRLALAYRTGTNRGTRHPRGGLL
ncbi:Mg chelatase-like protein [Mangrovactinospora gilvigrisea]|uniref:Mg chelatase-like protein n=1 Tax=Mangrovactinospora gilvigrisea TaxID=1428644 RepID=A0A1J7C5A9_9ACTN|nr:ATP-binding protein [Mangrovactinospora gilvigrisea]OIV36736.1 Mg chelatase-like protein [Mangrovactinospora gilvigrisea]